MESETPETAQGDRNGHNSETVEAPERTNRAASAAHTRLNAVQGRPESGGSDNGPATPTRTILPETSTPVAGRSDRGKDSRSENEASSEHIRRRNKYSFIERHEPAKGTIQTRERPNETEIEKDLSTSIQSTREWPSLVDAESSNGYPGIKATVDEVSSPDGSIIDVEATRNATRDADGGDVQPAHSSYERSSQWDHSPIAHAASRPTFGTFNWRAADRFRETGVYSFNTSFENLREMAQAHVSGLAKKQRPQSAQDLRELFASALTESNSLLEENAVADARLKLQATQNAAYGIRLKERMTTLRLYIARASRQPSGVISELAVLVRKA